MDEEVTRSGSEIPTFEEIDVQRINVREPDGTLRMVMSNRERLPGLVVRGEEYSHDRPFAGMIFFNDEGTENGGLGFGGREGQSFGHVTFDGSERDEVLQLAGRQDGETYTAGLTVKEQPQVPVLDILRQAQEAREQPDAKKRLQEMEDSGQLGRDRVFVGQEDGDAVLDLKDGGGRSRLRLRVTSDGEASIDFLDAEGNTTASLGPDAFTS